MPDKTVIIVFSIVTDGALQRQLVGLKFLLLQLVHWVHVYFQHFVVRALRVLMLQGLTENTGLGFPSIFRDTISCLTLGSGLSRFVIISKCVKLQDYLTSATAASIGIWVVKCTESSVAQAANSSCSENEPIAQVKNKVSLFCGFIREWITHFHGGGGGGVLDSEVIKVSCCMIQVACF